MDGTLLPPHQREGSHRQRSNQDQKEEERLVTTTRVRCCWVSADCLSFGVQVGDSELEFTSLWVVRLS